MCTPCRKVLVHVILPTASLPNSISTPWVTNMWKTQRTAAMEASKWTGSETVDSTQPKKPQLPSKKLYDERNIKMWINQLISFHFHCQLRSFLLRVLNRTNGMGTEKESENERARKTNSLNLGLQYSFQYVNITYAPSKGQQTKFTCSTLYTHSNRPLQIKMYWCFSDVICPHTCFVAVAYNGGGRWDASEE